MIGTWKISDGYSEILRRFWADENIVSINELSFEDSSSLAREITVLVFSANCSESERKQVRKQLALSPDLTTYIFNDNAADTDLDSVKLDDLFVNEFSWIDSLQIPVVKHCNLNCNRCYHFSNLVSGKEIYRFEDYKRDIADIKQLAFSIGEVRFLGGEPLLNDNLLAYIEHMHLMFPYAVLKIVTNGLLITRLSPQQCAVLSRLNVIISVSLYAPLHNRFDAIETFLICNGIRYEIFRVGTRFDKILLKNAIYKMLTRLQTTVKNALFFTMAELEGVPLGCLSLTSIVILELIILRVMNKNWRNSVLLKMFFVILTRKFHYANGAQGTDKLNHILGQGL